MSPIECLFVPSIRRAASRDSMYEPPPSSELSAHDFSQCNPSSVNQI